MGKLLMPSLICITYVAVACAIVSLFGCTHNSESLQDYHKFEDGFYIVSADRQIDVFCKTYGWGDYGVVGFACKDMTCKFAGDWRVTIERVFLRDAVVTATYKFQAELVACGSSK